MNRFKSLYHTMGLCAVALSLAAVALAAPPADPPDVLNATQQSDQSSVKRDTLQSIGVETHERPQVTLQNCEQAFGHKAFCQCLGRHMAPGTSFDTYVRYVTRTKKALAYNESLPPRQKAIDLALKARDKCIGQYVAITGRKKSRAP